MVEYSASDPERNDANKETLHNANGRKEEDAGTNVGCRQQHVPDRDSFLRSMARLGVSDLHLKDGLAPRVRVAGRLKKLDLEALPSEEFDYQGNCP